MGRRLSDADDLDLPSRARPDELELLDFLEAVRQGDFTVRLATDTTEVDGRVAALLNDIVAANEGLLVELQRVAELVGRDGETGERASVAGQTGDWARCLEAANGLIDDLVAHTDNITHVLRAVAAGDLSQNARIQINGRPIAGQFLHTTETINKMVDQLNAFASEVSRVAREVGTEGKLGGQARVEGVGGVWAELTHNVNGMADNLTAQVRNIAEVTTAVANGDLSKKVTVEVEGEILELKKTVNTMVDQLNAFAGEVTRVAREVGTEGRLGGQARVHGVGGIWKELTDNVNLMAANLTAQVRGIAQVVTAVARGDLRGRLTLDAAGEIAALANTINEMNDTLAVFADQVTTVAHEVGVEGKLGGQASVPGASGTWKDLTDNVNRLAGNLTIQLRAIANVATSVTEGDLTREIGVDAEGEVARVKDKINQMIQNLRETTLKNEEQDWLKTNLTHFSRLLQGQRDLQAASRLVLTELATLVPAHFGAFYTPDSSDPDKPMLRIQASYGGLDRQHMRSAVEFGEGLLGECALSRRFISISDVPAGYLRISSGIGRARPRSLVVFPALFEGELRAVIELASLERFKPIHLAFFEQLAETIGVVVQTIGANMRTEELLSQSQNLTGELQQASLSKSEFLNMAAHELRTPLSVVAGYVSMLSDGTLGGAPASFSEPLQILGSKVGELNRLVDDLLTAARVEVGPLPSKTTSLDLRTVARKAVVRARPRATLLKGRISLTVPRQPVMVEIDPDHVARILDNLINNALTYCDRAPSVRIEVTAREIPTIRVEDNGIGIPVDLKEQVFERFFRISDLNLRPVEGTGLGLYLSRSLAERYGGSLTLDWSRRGVGSAFVLRLPSDDTLTVSTGSTERTSPLGSAVDAVMG